MYLVLMLLGIYVVVRRCTSHPSSLLGRTSIPRTIKYIILTGLYEMKIINITHSVHVLKTCDTDTMYLCGTDTMYLCGIKSIVKVFLFFSAVEFYTGEHNTGTVQVYAFNRK